MRSGFDHWSMSLHDTTVRPFFSRSEVVRRESARTFSQLPFQKSGNWIPLEFQILHGEAGHTHSFYFGLTPLLTVVLHYTCFSSRALTFRRPLYNLQLLCIALRLVRGCSTARSSSRSGYRTTIAFKTGVVSRFTSLNSIWNVERQQWLNLFRPLKLTINQRFQNQDRCVCHRL